ncbi:hypothetical protein RRG08_026236 [Elysia crispata]|uniref:Uncharacterized protein n=1 Tax=Elysia crispata TaxID=231223 RepID=A0AAE1DDB7_9GAST|nr:hypothetical protein RRG08_026236 [Elysia crispata]
MKKFEITEARMCAYMTHLKFRWPKLHALNSNVSFSKSTRSVATFSHGPGDHCRQPPSRANRGVELSACRPAVRRSNGAEVLLTSW